MSAGARFAAFFNLQPGEGPLVSALLGYSFCIGVARMFTLSAGYALFLDAFDVGALPVVYIAVTLCLSLAGAIFFQLQARLGLGRLVALTLGALGAVLLAFRVGLALPGARWVAIALPVYSEVLWSLSNLAFGVIAGRVLTLRQGRRLFTLVETGESVAVISGGLLTPVVGALVGAANLLLVAVAGLGGALLLLVSLARRAPAAGPVSDAGAEAPPARSDLRTLLGQRYVLLVLLVNGLNVVCYYLLDSAFYAGASAQFADAAAFAGFLGLFYALSEVFGLLSRTLLSGRLLTRYGLTIGILAQPVVVTALVLATVGAGLLPAALVPATTIFWLVALAKLLDSVTGEDLSKAATLILYQPLPPEARLRTQILVDGGVTPLATGLVGLILLAAAGLGELGTAQRLALALPPLIAWTLLAALASREYPRMLQQALSRRWLGRGTPVPADSASLAVFRDALASPHPGLAIFALGSLEQRGDAALTMLLPSLLEHPAPEVRREGLRRVEERRLAAALPAVLELAGAEGDPAVRGAALRALAALAEGEGVERIAPLLAHPEPEVRLGAMVGLLRCGDLEGTLLAGESLVRLCDSADPAERALAARALGELGARAFYRPLLRLLNDPEATVRRAAVMAVGQGASPRLWPAVAEAALQPETRQAALTALAHGSDEAAAAVAALMQRPELGQRERARLLRALSRIQGSVATAALAGLIEHGETTARAAAIAGLVQRGYRATGQDAVVARLALQAEAIRAAWALAAAADLDDTPALALLRGALLAEARASRDRALALLSFVVPARALGGAREGLAHSSAEQRGYAVELIDIVLPAELKPLMLPLVEELTLNERVARLRLQLPLRRLDPGMRVEQLIRSGPQACSAWVRACALYAAAMAPVAEAASTVRAACFAPELLVRESAVWALLRLEGETLEPVRGVRSRTGGGWMLLSTVERVLALKATSFFAETPEPVLVELAALLREERFPAGATIFRKGEPGTSMYLIAAGRVHAIDGERTLIELGFGEVVGEMAALDTQPRSADVLALEDTLLLRLDQGPLYELMADRFEIARNVIHTLSRRLRNLLEVQRGP